MNGLIELNVSFGNTRFLYFVLLSLVATPSYGRLFDYSELKFGTILRGSAGTVHIDQGAYGDSMGTSTYFDSQPDHLLSGEFGFIILSPTNSIVISVEYMTPTAQQGIIGSRNGSGKLMTLDSYVYAAVAWLGLEYPFLRRPHSRMIIAGYGGVGQVWLNNYVRLSDDGVAAYPLATERDYQEQAIGSIVGARGIFGWEFLLSDNVTFVAETGYRYIMVPGVAATVAVDTVNGSVSKNSDLKNNSGQVRELNLSGAFVGINFRFYFQ